MRKIDGYDIQYDFSGFKKIADLIFFEGPFLSHYVSDKGDDYLFYWVDKDETDKNEWTIFGCPTTKLCFASPETAELTCADVVNRIPDIINAPKGFITTSKMASAKYIKESLND